jgi:hypothetical protein
MIYKAGGPHSTISSTVSILADLHPTSFTGCGEMLEDTGRWYL